jgi:hypothetical protein
MAVPKANELAFAGVEAITVKLIEMLGHFPCRRFGHAF